jgi:hypothetical protein
VLVGLVDRAAASHSQRLHCTGEEAAIALVLGTASPIVKATKTTDYKFLVSEPALAPLVPFLQAAEVCDKVLKYCFTDSLLVLAKKCNADSARIPYMVKFMRLVTETFDLPEDYEPHPLILRCLSEAETAVRALEWVFQPQITSTTSFSVLGALRDLVDHAENPRQSGVINAVGLCVKKMEDKYALVMDVLACDKFQQKATEFQRHIRQMEAATDFEEKLAAVRNACSSHEQYSAAMPQKGVLDGYVKVLGATCMTVFTEYVQNSTDPSKNITEPEKLSAFLNTLVDASRVLPHELAVDDIQMSVAARLHELQRQNSSHNVVAILSKAQLQDGFVTDESVLEIKSLFEGITTAPFAFDEDAAKEATRASDALMASIVKASSNKDAAQMDQFIDVFKKTYAYSTIEKAQKTSALNAIECLNVLVKASVALSAVKLEDPVEVVAAEDVLVRFCRAVADLEPAAKRLKGDHVSDLLLRIEVELADGLDKRKAYGVVDITQHIAKFTPMAVQLMACSGGHPDGEGKLWYVALPANADWAQAMDHHSNSLAKFDVQPMEKLVAELEQHYSTFKLKTQTYRLGESTPAWDAAKEALDKARLTSACRVLMDIYIDEAKDAVAMRSATTAEMAKLRKHGLTLETLPSIFKLRAAKAIKMKPMDLD